ncbi:MAG: TolC family outer membrane protein [Paucibacter sp.]|nr:TolC family outer membrane protein [Roseateles sp.]
MKRLLFIALALPTLAQAENLLDVYAQARAADPVLAAAAARQGMAGQDAVIARSRLLPQWNLAATELRSRPNDGSGHVYSSQISQTVFDLGRLREWDAAYSQSRAQDSLYRAAEQELCARVASAYFGVLSAQASLDTAQANESAFTAQVEQAQARFESGLSAAADLEQARAYAGLARTGTVAARQSLLDAREALAEITGRKAETLAPLVAELPAHEPSPATPDAWVERALALNPELSAGRLQLAAAESSVAAARAGHLPTLSFTVDSNRQRGTGLFSPSDPRTLSQLGLTLNIPIFAGGATQAATHKASLAREAQREQLEADRRALIREVRGQYEAVMGALAQIEAGHAAVVAADKALESTRTGQQLGTRTMTDLLLGIQTQAQARNAEAQARHRYVLAMLLLQRAAGSLGEPELAAVNSLLKD